MLFMIANCDLPRFCDLPQLGLIRFTGPDAGSFLHNQLTCDVGALGVGRATYGGYCTPKGRALATFLLWRATADQYYMQLPGALSEAIRKRLSMYVLRAKVKLEDAAAQWRVAGLAGADAGAHLERALGVVPRADHDVAVTTGAMAVRLPIERFLVLTASDGDPARHDRLRDGTQPMSPDHWQWLDIRAGIPAVTPATQEQFVPQMVNLDLIGGLSYSKGCYPGQEIVARTHFLGRLKQRTYRIHLPEGVPEPGDKLYGADLGGQASGMIVNAAPSPEGGYDALAAMQITSAASGVVRWKAADGPAVEILKLPYEVTTDG